MFPSIAAAAALVAISLLVFGKLASRAAPEEKLLERMNSALLATEADNYELAQSILQDAIDLFPDGSDRERGLRPARRLLAHLQHVQEYMASKEAAASAIGRAIDGRSKEEALLFQVVTDIEALVAAKDWNKAIEKARESLPEYTHLESSDRLSELLVEATRQQQEAEDLAAAAA